jgi:hypothetical protein
MADPQWRMERSSAGYVPPVRGGVHGNISWSGIDVKRRLARLATQNSSA